MSVVKRSFELITEAKNVIANCNEIAFKNDGTATAYVVGMELVAGENISFPSSDDEEVDQTTYKISFAPTGTKKVFAIRKTVTK